MHDPSHDPAHDRSVVVLTEDSKPATGGIAEYLHQLAVALSEKHHVVVVTSVAGAERENAGLPFQYREVPWFRAQARMRGDRLPFMRRVNTLRWQATERSRVRRLLQELVHDYPGATFVLGRVSRVTSPWLVACRSLGISCLAFAYGRELLEEGIPFAARETVEHWFPISEATARVLAGQGIPRDHMTVLLPGIAPPPEKKANADPHVAAPYVLSIGMLRPRKGIDLALRAFADIAPEFPQLEYVVVGDGPEGERLQQMARDLGVATRVRWLGEVDDRQRDALLQGCTLFVLPTREVDGDMEGFGLVFLEAARAGKPAIGGRAGGVVEAIVDGTTGVLVDTRAGVTAGVEILSHTLRQLLNDAPAATRLGRQAQRHATRSFSWGARAQTFSMAMQLARRGRLRSYLGGGHGLVAFTECRREILRWIERAMGDGTRGMPAGYHVLEGWDHPYPEVTGYLIPTLLRESHREGFASLSEVAKAAGDWLVRTRLPDGAICQKQWRPDNTTPSVFNTAQVIEGWSALAQTTGEDRWLAAARKAADWLVKEQEPDGSWVRSAFHGGAHSYYARAAAVLAELGQQCDEDRYVESGRRALTWVIRQQRDDGWFDHMDFTANNASDNAPTTHTIGYVLEGLIRGAAVLHDDTFRQSADVAAKILHGIWSTSGTLPGRFIEGWQPVARSRCLTGEAQVGLAWAMLGQSAAAREIAKQVSACIRVVPEWPEISGGVAGSVPLWGDYDPYRYPAHAAKFALDLLALVEA